ncbi:hypothetical protein JCM33374_g4941 [Metschnikowia sp. JCM 33374]|nr:hypothetical protein JCM33374_g4941 [Metschnikowia sp. JCM 33374]
MGDGPVSLDSTINCLEDCLVEFLTDLSQESLQFARMHGRSRIKVDDVPFALRNDPPKLGRMDYIRESLAKIEKAKKLYDTNNVTANEKEYFSDEEDEDHDNEGARPSKKAKKKERARKKKNDQAAAENSNESD